MPKGYLLAPLKIGLQSKFKCALRDYITKKTRFKNRIALAHSTLNLSALTVRGIGFIPCDLTYLMVKAIVCRWVIILDGWDL